MELSAQALVVARYIHIVAGILWIGLHYFANLVSVPLIASLAPQDRALFVTNVIPRFLAFRYAALVNVGAGFVLLYGLYWEHGDVIDSDGSRTVGAGMLLGVVMLILVWLVIYPSQSAVVRAVRSGTQPSRHAEWRALFASRITFALSVPLIFLMVSAAHAPLDVLTIIAVVVVGAGAGFLVVYGVQRRAQRWS